VALGIEVLVERMLARARWIIWDDGERAFVGDGLPDVVGVVGCIGHHDVGGSSVDQGAGLGRVALLAGGEDEPHRTAQASNGEMDFGAQAAARASDGVIFRPPFFAPAAC
jgi:hypothetical protein